MIMTPKEKAKELYSVFHEFTPLEYEHEYTKRAAIKCVDEIIEYCNDLSADLDAVLDPITILYIEELDKVKKEIEKL